MMIDDAFDDDNDHLGRSQDLASCQHDCPLLTLAWSDPCQAVLLTSLIIMMVMPMMILIIIMTLIRLIQTR